MRISTLLTLGSGFLASAIPLEKRQSITSTDATVLQLALYLEHLEYAFYSGGCNSYTEAQFQASGFPAGFRKQICVTAQVRNDLALENLITMLIYILQQEQTHIDTISKVLTTNGQTPIPVCTYTFPYSDPKSFVALANMIST